MFDWSFVWSVFQNGSDMTREEIIEDLLRNDWLTNLPQEEQNRILKDAPREILLRVNILKPFNKK